MMCQIRHCMLPLLFGVLLSACAREEKAPSGRPAEKGTDTTQPSTPPEADPGQPGAAARAQNSHSANHTHAAGNEMAQRADGKTGAQQHENAKHAAGNQGPSRAVAVLTPVGDSGVNGTVYFERHGDRIVIRGEVRGLSPGEHGFHIHEFGDLTDDKSGKSAGDHYNPTGQPHGRHEDKERHVGDFGNIEADETGHAIIQIEDDRLQLHGPHAVIGRALVVHANPDKFTQPSGDAGDRVAFGVIGVAKAEESKKESASK